MVEINRYIVITISSTAQTKEATYKLRGGHRGDGWGDAKKDLVI
jgi:hypothetical protein